jgi:ankyrin repeat protein
VRSQEAEFLEACKAGDESTVRAMVAQAPSLTTLRADTGETPVMAALYRGHQGIVDALVEAGAPLDVFAAAALGRGDVVEAELVKDSKAIDNRAYDGWTALHLAAFFGRTPVVKLLIERGANLLALSTNSISNTPLHAAVAGGRVESALALIEAGSDVNAPDGGGHTPLHIAAEGGYIPIVEALLHRNANPHAVDAEDRTPLARAAARNHSAVIDLITLSGSTINPPSAAES